MNSDSEDDLPLAQRSNPIARRAASLRRSSDSTTPAPHFNNDATLPYHFRNLQERMENVNPEDAWKRVRRPRERERERAQVGVPARLDDSRPSSTPVTDPSNVRPPPSNMRSTPRPSYLSILSHPSLHLPPPSAPPAKSHLLILDLDNTLLAPLDHSSSTVLARPYLRTFLSYLVHPLSPYFIAFWTFSGRSYGIAHLRALGVGDLVFEDEGNEEEPRLREGVLAFYGYQDSGLTGTQMGEGVRPTVKDLDIMWEMINLRQPRGSPTFGPLNSLLCDDVVTNADAQPSSLLLAPKFFALSPLPTIDSFLLQLIGALEALALETNMAAALEAEGWREGFAEEDQDAFEEAGRARCGRMGIKISRGRRAIVGTFLAPNVVGPLHDVAPPTTDRKGRVNVEDLRGCCPDPVAVVPSAAERDAQNAILFPSSLYEKIVEQPSKELGRPRHPLVVLDLDGTLYARPPCSPPLPPLPRPFLLNFLTYLLSPSSPWTIAIWTSSLRSTAVRSLTQLDLGIVGKNEEEVEILHPKIVAVWTREDLGLDTTDFCTYVRVTKDLDLLWEHLAVTGVGHWSPYNSVMVDDTSFKLRGQPSSLINPPSFTYPLPSTPPSPHDTFLLQLIGALSDLSTQSNFANFIHEEGWNDDFGRGGRGDQLARKGIQSLAKAKIYIDAKEGGPVPLPVTGRRIPFKIGTTVVARSNDTRGPHLDSAPTRVSAPIAADSTPLLPQQPSQRRSTFGNSTSCRKAQAPTRGTDSIDNRTSRLRDATRSTAIPRRRTRLDPIPPTPSHPTSLSSSEDTSSPTSPSSTTSSTDEDEVAQRESRFVEEEARLASLHGHPWKDGWRKESRQDKLGDAVRAWEADLPSRDVPLVQSRPYQVGRRS